MLHWYPFDLPPDYPFPSDPANDPPLTSGNHGKDCLGNGEHPEYECCCDECNYFLFCFPEWLDPDYYGDPYPLEEQ